MSIPTDTRPASGACGPQAGPSDLSVPGPARGIAWLNAIADPEWPLLLAVLLAPAGLCLAMAEWQKASFFLGAGVYVACLKWLGWAVFGRLALARPRFLLFPAELFAGLAVVCAWFYLRNLLAKLWPASYSLGELAWLFPALVVLHVAALALRTRSLRSAWQMSPSQSLTALGERLALYVPFVVVLLAALWSVSAALGVQGTDPMTYTFLARTYRTEGIDFAVPPTNQIIVYPSGFGTMNATAAALAPLTVVQAFHLQHVLLCVAALFLVTATVAALARRPLSLLHSLPVPFLFLFPLYALYPDVLYPGTPKQAGPPLFAAICLLPLLGPIGRRGTFILAVGVVAFLAVLAVALNPACGPYTAVATVVAGVIFAQRGRANLQLPRWQTAAGLVGAGLIGAGLVFACDLYYRPLLRDLLGSGSPPAPVPVPDSKPGPDTGASISAPVTQPARFSWSKAAVGLVSVNPLALSPVESTTGLVWDRGEPLRGWGDRWPSGAIVFGAFGLILFALAGLLPPQTRAKAIRDPLVHVLLAGLALWLGLKYVMTFWIAGLSRADHLTGLLSVYGRYLLLRCEFLLLFTFLAAGGTRLFLTLEARSSRAARRTAAAGAVAFWLLPAHGLSIGVLVTGFPVVPTTDRFMVTPDDVKLAAWLADNVPPDKGNIGLAAFTFTAGPNDIERYIFPLGGGHALPLYGRHYNFRFFLPNLEGDGGTGYRQHVHDGFDPRWCRANDVRYFYATPDGLARNPGLARAVGDGRLRLVHQEGDSCVYEVAEETVP
jgi:hypothetical protein